MTNIVFVISAVVISFALGLAFGYILTVTRTPKQKYDGTLSVSETDSSQIHQLEINTDPEELKEQDSVVFKVRKVPTVEE